jgi:DMSO/TMAO reductase YedYZ molybdopterin-dependent catalytic subunit
MQFGLALSILLTLLFFSGGLFYLYVFNYDVGPFFTATRLIHFYVGIASVPFLLAKYGSTTLRFTGYYLRLPRFKAAGPPALLPRILSPLLALDFFVLYFSGAYMLFHYYYTVTNIPPLMLKPVQLHLWAALLAVPLLAVHLGAHFLTMVRGLARERRELLAQERLSPESTRRVMTRRAFVGTVIAGGLGLAFTFQNTAAANVNVRGLFIGRIPREERNGPGAFPVETLFGSKPVDVSAWRLRIDGAVAQPAMVTYEQLLALPAVTKEIRINCVSGWSAVPVWSGPRLTDVLALAQPDAAARGIHLHSITGYTWTWHRNLLTDDALLATHVNGAPISQNHGFPTRFILAGYPGENMVKQLDTITVQMQAEQFAPDFGLTA